MDIFDGELFSILILLAGCVLLIGYLVGFIIASIRAIQKGDRQRIIFTITIGNLIIGGALYSLGYFFF